MIKNLQKASERIKLAAKNGERIILYGDSDCDGVTSTVILKEAIKSLGGEVFMVFFPDRENDGYGLNARALSELKDKSPALLITLDLGIGNVKEIKMARDLGFEVIVIDHHESLEKLPEANIIVDPKQPGDESDFQYLCNAGLVFKLCEELLKDDFSMQMQNSFLELVALATISDMVPQIGENKLFIEKGLRSLKNTFRPGLRVFFEKFGEGEIVSGGFSKIISLINVAESKDWKNESYDLLTSSSLQIALIILENLTAKIFYKQQKIKEISEEVSRRVSQKSGEVIIFEGDPAWKLTLAGPVASIIAQRYGKPTFIFKKMETESCGSVRSLGEGENAVEAMKTCQDFLITYGGHAKAAGFRVKNEDLETFKNRLSEYFKK
jgi:single-stranded-DNA-specific exonuclease